LTIAPSDIAARPDPSVETIPAVLSAIDIQRILQVSRPTAYAVIAACHPIRIGRLTRVLGQDFKDWLEAGPSISTDRFSVEISSF
jgi:hypothetical protein